jgi:hypothetical protein
VNPFDQPSIHEIKESTRFMLDHHKKEGRLPDDEPAFRSDGLAVFCDATNREALGLAASAPIEKVLAAHLGRLSPGDYLALTAFLDRGPAIAARLTAIRQRIRDARRVATTLGFGPRYLHSTGQLHKGGPATGVFIQITADTGDDLPIPGERHTFGTLAAAQARADFQSLSHHGRLAIRIHLGPQVDAGLAHLEQAVKAAL